MYWLTGILGLIMIVAPYVLGFSGDPGALWTNIILGVVVLLASAYKAIARDVALWEYWVAGIAGVLAVVAPFTFGFSAQAIALWTTLILGAVVAILAGIKVFAPGKAQPHHEQT